MGIPLGLIQLLNLCPSVRAAHPPVRPGATVLGDAPLPSFSFLEETRQTQEQPFHGAIEVVHSFVVEVHLVRVQVEGELVVDLGGSADAFLRQHREDTVGIPLTCPP